MKSLLGIILGTALVVAACTGVATVASAQTAAKSDKNKIGQWQGHILRINEKKSTMTIRGGRSPKDNFQRQVSFDSSTEWTKQGQPAQQADFKEGSFVIVQGNMDKKGMLHATRIDLRLPR